MCKAIVWADSRTRATVAHFESKLKETGIQVEPGVWKKGKDGVEALRDMWVIISLFFLVECVLTGVRGCM